FNLTVIAKLWTRQPDSTSLVSACAGVFLALNLWDDLIAYLMVPSNSSLHKYFLTPVRELSVLFEQGDGNGETTRMFSLRGSGVRRQCRRSRKAILRVRL